MELMQAPLPANAEFAAVRSGDSSSDAKRLALCFQAMARALDKFMWTSLYFARAGVSPSKDLARNRDRKHPRTMLDMVEAYQQATVLCALRQTAYKAGAVPPEGGSRSFFPPWPRQSTS